MTESLTLIRPDDWHLHLRDGVMMTALVPETARHFGRALIMPNLTPPVVRAADARAYKKRIMAAGPQNASFTPLMTLYLTEQTDPDALSAAFEENVITAVKYYPAGATTNSDKGVRNINKVMHVLEKMCDIGIPLCIHGEVTDPASDIFDREKIFIETILTPLRTRLPDLKIVLEHVTTKEGVDYVLSAPKGLGATLTTHHLMINRNAILSGGLKPHYYCLPVAKRESHRQALRRAATSGDARFFLGTDSAPHVNAAKESACGCAGIFTATNTLSCLAHVFEEEGALDALEAFTSLNGAAFYGVPPNEGHVTLTKKTPPTYPAQIPTPAGNITLFNPGVKLAWRVVDPTDQETA